MENVILPGRKAGPGEPPYFIAEIGANHNGDMVLCKRMIDAAKSAGVDAVKFQSWSKSSLISRAEYTRNAVYADKKRHFGTLEEMVARYQLTPEQHREAADYCRQAGVTFLSSCFSPAEADLLEDMDVPAFKIASMDVNHPLLLEHVARKGRPVILSTGMATLGEIEKALWTLQKAGPCPVILLHCVSVYPPDAGIINLRNITMLHDAFSVPVGYSDHTLGTSIPMAAIALGACVVEKHFTLDKDLEGWDHAISADPAELAYLVAEGKNVWASLGSATRTVSDAEMEKRKIMRRRIVAARAMRKGEVLRREDLDFKRPGDGIHPDEWLYAVGRTLTRDVSPDDELEWSDLA